jgi:hypothetical protein
VENIAVLVFPADPQRADDLMVWSVELTEKLV